MALSKFLVGTSAPGVAVHVYGLQGNVDLMFGTVTKVSAAGPSEFSTSVAGHTRKRYPGDGGVSVKTTTKKYLRDPGVRYGQGIPGRSFSVACWDADGNLLHRRQFSSNDSVRELNALLLANFLATPGLGKIMKHYAKAGGVHTFERP